MKIVKNKQIKVLLKQLISFSSIGFLILFVNYGLFELFSTIFNLGYRIAVSGAYLIAVMLHFVLNRQVTFNVKNGELTMNMIRYLIMLSINYILIIIFTDMLVKILHQSPRLLYIFSPFITSSISFLMMKFFVFKKKLVLIATKNP